MKKYFYANKRVFVLEIRKGGAVAEIFFYPVYSEPDIWGDITPSAPLKNTNPFETMREGFGVLKEALFETNYRTYMILLMDNEKTRMRLYSKYIKKLEKSFDIQVVNNNIIYLFRKK